MSSFIGHAATACAVFVSHKDAKSDFTWRGFLWLGCLGFAAIAPDLDYFVPFLGKSNFDGLRVSHSFAFAMLFPILAVAVLAALRTPATELRLRGIQIFCASASHIFLDFLVAVHPLPLFWPLIPEAFTCPFGLLPSAGALSLTNFYFYRNLAIELGVLMPIYVCIQLFIHRRATSTQHRIIIASLAVVSAVCVFLAYGLSRG